VGAFNDDRPAAARLSLRTSASYVMNRIYTFKILVLTVAVLIADIGIAALFKATTGEHFWESYKIKEREFRTTSDVYHHDLEKNAAVDGLVWGSYRYNIRTNSLGFKDAVVRDISLQSPTPRMLFIGDSFTEGIGHSYEDTFVGLVDDALEPKGWDVLNAGVASYSPLIYWKKIEYLLDQGLQVDRVVVCIDISDAEDDAVYYGLSKDGRIIRQDPSENATGVRAIWGEVHKVRTVIASGVFRMMKQVFAVNEYAIHMTRAQWTFEPSVFEAYGKTGLERMDASMTALAELLKARQIDLAVVVYPWPDQVLFDRRDSKHVVFWREWSKRHGASFIDLFPLFVFDDKTVEERKRIVDAFYIPRDVHFNQEGNIRVAEALVKELPVN
jgi:hypothetical protein